MRFVLSFKDDGGASACPAAPPRASTSKSSAAEEWPRFGWSSTSATELRNREMRSSIGQSGKEDNSASKDDLGREEYVERTVFPYSMMFLNVLPARPRSSSAFTIGSA